MSIYDASDVPEKVMKNFAKYVDLYPDEQLQLLYDKTVMESGKEGMAITNKRLVAYNKRRQQSYYHEDLANAKYTMVEESHYKLVMVTRSGDINTLDVYLLGAHLQRIVDLMRLHVDEAIWSQSESKAKEVATSNMGPVLVTEDKSLLPICPHCEKELPQVCQRDLTSMLGRRFVYFCPHCQKVLGFSHRQGYLLGR